MKRINVVGTSGSGKSRFSKKLADSLGFKYIEMDALFWKKDWLHKNDEEFFPDLKKELISAENWVLDGNYTRSIPIKWKMVDTVIWLDYSITRTLYQATKRAITRSITKEELWPDTGNKESFRRAFLSSDSILLWTLSNYRGNRRKYNKAITDTRYSNIKFVRLSSPKMGEKFLNEIVRETTRLSETGMAY